MNAALTLKGGQRWPAQTKARQLNADRLGWEADDPQIDPHINGGINVIEPVRANGFSIFLFRAWHGDDPDTWATLFAGTAAECDLPRLGLEGKQCALDADVECDDPAIVLRILRRIRKLRAGRGLTWSFQPIKGGVISDELRDFINADPMITVAPFLYRDNMSPVSERWVVNDLLAWGIVEKNQGGGPKITPYYGRWCEGWNGFLYDLGGIA